MAARTRGAFGEDCYAGVVKKLSEFLTIHEHVEFWNGQVWWGGHPGSGRSPSSPKYDPSKNGREHNGTDFACQRGDLRAPHDGLIRYARWQNNGAGHAVTINHGDTLIDVGTRFAGEIRRVYTRHLHMSPDKKWQTKTFKVREGQTVIRGQLLGTSGNSGSSAGVHDHCEAPVDRPYQPAHRHMNLDTELIYTGVSKGYWGEEDEEVIKGIQTALTIAGYNPGDIDGIWGPATELAFTQMCTDAKEGGGNLPGVEEVLVLRYKEE